MSKLPEYLHQYHIGLKQSCPQNVLFCTAHPLQQVLSFDRLSPSYGNFILNVSSTFEPHTYSQAVQFDHRKLAMQQELDALEYNKTWVITSLPTGAKALGCKWVYKVKFHLEGTVERYKARLMAKVYT